MFLPDILIFSFQKNVINKLPPLRLRELRFDDDRDPREEQRKIYRNAFTEDITLYFVGS